jgi:hypothetical protein
VGPDQPPEASDEQETQDQPKPADDAPTLEVVDPEEAEANRPAWLDIPGRKLKTMMRGHSDAPLFGFHLQGGAVDNQGVRIGFLAQFLESFRKVYEPLQVFATGYVPEGNNLPATSADGPRVAALGTTGSITIIFALGPEEMALAAKRGDQLSTLQSVKATGHLGALLSIDPEEDDLLRSIEPFGKRIGRSYGQLAQVLGENDVETDWWSDTYGASELEVTAPEARIIADELIHKPIPESETYEVGGFMWDAATGDAKQRFVRIRTHQRSIKASYDIPLTTAVTVALSHVVRAEIRETAYRFPFAEKPHRREWELVRILEIGDSAGALAEAEQLQLEGTDEA